jgi:DNA-binding CsgD family transcriptional regulator
MSDFNFLKSWISARLPSPAADGPGVEMREEFEQFFTHIFNNSKDGISILALDFTIVGVNTTIENWYRPGPPLVGRRCYEAYHGRTGPCAHCPSAAAIRTGRPQVGVVPYDLSGRVRGDQELSVFPLYDDDRKLFCLIEYVRDITSLAGDARILENLKRRIQFQDQTLMEQEAALTALLRQGGRAERRVSQDIARNLDALIMPLVSRLKAAHAGTDSARDIELLETRLREVASPHGGRLAAELRGLTRREGEIAAHVREGRTSKEIAERLCISIKAVDFHRMRIRRKLGLGKADGHLQAYLASLENPS